MKKGQLMGKKIRIPEKTWNGQPKHIFQPEIIQNHRRKWEWFLYLGVFMLSLLFFPILVSTALFIFHISITVVNIPLSLALSCIVLYILTDGTKKGTAIIVIVGIIFAIVAVIVCMRVYDWTWDGNSYHKSIAGLLRYGWNPLYETFYDYGGKKFLFFSGVKTPWLDAYPKGSEIWGACVYAVTNNIESGKAFNLISMIGSFCVCLGLLGLTERVKPWHTVLCVFLSVVNPISLSQCFTYYNDGFLWQMVTVYLAALFYLTFYEHGKYRWISMYLIFLCINVGLNIKYSGLIFFGIIGISFFIFWSVERFCADGYTIDTKKFIGKRFIFLALCAISGVSVTGATSYVINIMRHNNPLYLAIGKDSLDLIDSQLPAFQKNMTNIERVITSLFFRTSNNKGLETIEWKIPFFFDGAEYTAAQGYDTHLAGWGIFFSGLFIVGLCVLIWWLTNNNRYKRPKKVAVMLLVVYLISLFCVPGLSWARYNVGMFYIPIGGMFILFAIKRKGNNDICTYIAGVLGAVFVINMIPSVTKIDWEFRQYNTYHTQLEKLCENMRNNKITIGTAFRGRLFSLVDQGITEFEYKVDISEEEKDGTVFSPYGIDYSFSSGLLSAKSLEDIFVWAGQSNLITLIAVCDEGSTALTNFSIQSARSLGLDFDLANDGFRKSYCAILDGGTVVHEEMSDQKLSQTLIMDGHELLLISAGFEVGKLASIQVDGVEHSLNLRGINIVFINRETWEVVDSLCVDSYLDNKVYR